MKIAENVLGLIGNTPLVKINRLNQNGCANVVAKLESFNPAGSIKDRTALSMIEDAEKRGLLTPGAVIIEPTSGNTGIGLAMVCAVKGYKMILTMPETMSIERRKLLQAFGAEIVLTDGEKGMKGSIDKAMELREQIPDSFIPMQFNNPANPEIHETTTAEVIAGVGTGGTISGIGKRLKEKNPDIKIVAIEPFRSQVLAGKPAGSHAIQGIGANFVPRNFNREVVDVIYPVGDIDAVDTARKLATDEGILCGISSGAAMYAALEFSKMRDNEEKLIVTILPDTGERYLSSVLFS